jgi:catechol 2,3-dioxygenase-like lactoylglutathione lyase family enzyme
MTQPIPGIHHVTAIAGDPQQNIDFYTGLLGLRLVKLTVNFDDPRAYHLYYGDGAGSPGTILTFFAWPGARRGQPGAGQIGVTSFAVPSGSLGYWRGRLTSAGVRLDTDLTAAEERFGERILTFQDHDGLPLELVEREGAADQPFWDGADVPGEHALRGFGGVTLEEEGFESTRQFLTDVMGFQPAGADGQTFRFTTGESGPGSVVDVRTAPNLLPGRIAVGSVHHVAWRVPDDQAQVEWRETLATAGLNVTPVLDRQYFHSIYFNEPGGVIFEIATDPPGFTADEAPETLGTHLKLPPWFEPRRALIERSLPPVRLPEVPSPR